MNVRLALRSARAGLLWLMILFVWDGLDSLGLISRSIHHIEPDPAQASMMFTAVADYVVRVGIAHAVIGLLVGALLGLALWLWFPQPPSARRWWLSAGAVALVSTVLFYARQAVAFPPVQDWMGVKALSWWVDHVSLRAADAAWVTCLVAFVLLSGRRALRARMSGRQFGVRLLALAAAASTVTWILLPPRPKAPVANAEPNIILLGIDSLRPDHLASAGYFRDTAPHIDALLADSVVFESAWTQLARTYPAWTTLMSGVWPTRHGIRDNLPSTRRIVPDLPLLPQVAQRAGWQTWFVTDDSRFSYMVPEVGFDHIVQPQVSLQNFVISSNEPRFRAFHGLMHNTLGFTLVPVIAYNQAFGKTYRPWLFEDRALTALADATQSGRFLWTLHSCVLHAPGDRVWPWHQMYGQQGYDGANRFRYGHAPTNMVFDDADQDEADKPDSIEQDARIYDSGVDMADRLVARLVASLKEAGTYDQTTIIVFSDHGEEHWAAELPYRYSGPNHGFHPYGNGQYRVLLGIKLPKQEQAGRRVEDPVRLMDLAPTVAELMGVDWPSEIDGESLLPLARGEVEAEPRPVYFETGLSEKRYWPAGHLKYPFKRVAERYDVDPETNRVFIREEFIPQLIAGKDRVMQVGRWKLIWRAMRDEPLVQLFDIVDDPLNNHDLAAEHPDVVATLGARLAPFLEGDGVASPLFEQWRAEVATTQADSGATTERPERKEAAP